MLSHVSEHMVFGSLSPEIRLLIQKLAAEYGLMYEGELFTLGVKVMKVKQSADYKTLKKNFINSINSLSSGTWLWIEHPAMAGFETEGMKLSGNNQSVSISRNNIYKLLNDFTVKKAIKRKKIKLIGFNFFIK